MFAFYSLFPEKFAPFPCYGYTTAEILAGAMLGKDPVTLARPSARQRRHVPIHPATQPAQSNEQGATIAN